MASEKFLLVSLKEDEAKKLAQVISNDTSRKILDFLASRKDATETEIATHLEMPLSTTHYNLQALVKAKLVAADEFHYSDKGKEVNHYSLANKYVIIAPANAPETLRERLKRFLPVATVALTGAAALQLYKYLTFEPIAPAPEAFDAEAPMLMAKAAVQETVTAAPPHIWANPEFWFLYGVVFAIITFVVVDYLRKK
jgi:DNA-binding transcriptional ArsR family regulator